MKANKYGSWHSPISAEMVGAKGTRLGHMQTYDGKVYWLESRPSEQGRGVIVCYDGQKKFDVNDLATEQTNISVRSKVHEYGSADFLVTALGIFFSEEKTQKICLLSFDGQFSQVTHASSDSDTWRFTDYALHPNGRYLYAVREIHTGQEVVNELVKVDLSAKSNDITVVAQGYDFYSFPRLSPGGRRISWTCWNQPQMPWDGTELWIADINCEGDLTAPHKVAGASDESIYQPSWSPDGVLHFVSDRSGWWNIYSFRDGIMNALTPTDHDFGIPQWVFGTSTYCFGEDDNIYASYFEKGEQLLAHINTDSGHIEPIKLPFRDFGDQLHFSNNQLMVIAGAPDLVSNVYQIDLDSGKFQNLSADDSLPVPKDFISKAEPIEFTSKDGNAAYAYYYAPLNPNFTAQEDEKPPLIVMSHGGPTAATTSSLSWAIQFWTSRGFAVVDVNYSGSTGYGREYRRKLNGNWGVVDVNDCVYAARYLVDQGKADKDRLAIRGGSAGGYTTLCALTFFNDFSAGMTRYGVADLKSIATDSHKFEARYLDNLVGPYPKDKHVYEERSPLNHSDKLSCPLLVLQGSDDKVVPPSQSRQLVSALDKKQLPHAYIEFEGEAHGFRKQQNICFALQAELSFYRQVFKIQSDEVLPELILEHG